MRILIVEDEPKAAAYLKKGLSESGFVVDTASEGNTGLSLAELNEYDLIILDIMLPGRDGWGVLSEIRKRGNETPVLFLTAKDSVQDRDNGLRQDNEDAGA